MALYDYSWKMITFGWQKIQHLTNDGAIEDSSARVWATQEDKIQKQPEEYQFGLIGHLQTMYSFICL